MDLAEYLRENMNDNDDDIDNLYSHLKELNGGKPLADDFTILKLKIK